MNVLHGFQYMFYRVYSYQLKPWKDTPIYAAHIGVYAVSLAIGLNITTVLFALNSSLGDRQISPVIGILIFLCLFALFYFYFIPRERYKKIVKKFYEEKRANRIKNGILLWAYCVATIALLVASVLRFPPVNH